MARIAKETDYTVKVEGVGSFTFGRRAMRDEIDIQVAYARIIDGVEPTAWLQTVGGWIATFNVLTVRAPSDWNIETMDPTDPATYAKMRIVHEALSEKEGSFRRSTEPASQGSGAGTPS